MFETRDNDAPILPSTKTGARAPFFLALVGLWGCPNTGATPIAIDAVNVVGNAGQPTFQLELRGRGFGLDRVQYDVSGGTGTSSAAQLRVRMFIEGTASRTIPESNVRVESPQLIVASADLSAPLPPGTYDVELLRGVDTVAFKALAFRVEAANPTPDGGVPPPDDGGVGPDATPLDGAEDAGVDPPDTGPPDTGIPPDSGLGPFVGAFGFRQPVLATSAAEIPAGTTIQVPVAHLALVNASQAKGDATDIVLYQGTDALPHQWDDRFQIGTDELVLTARLLRAVPAGGSEADPLALYFGDLALTAVATDTVFEFAERFAAEVAPQGQGNDNAWYQAQNWIHCELDRPIEQILMNFQHAYCAVDFSNNNLVRQTLSTPRIPTVAMPPPTGQTYELSLWLAGQTTGGPADIMYLSHGPNNEDFDVTVLFPTPSYVGFAPNGNLTFQEVNGFGNRTVEGWRFPVATIQWWQRARVRFSPAFDQPSLHFRHVSTAADGQNNDSFAGIDDLWVRVAADPEPSITLGPIEAR